MEARCCTPTCGRNPSPRSQNFSRTLSFLIWAHRPSELGFSPPRVIKQTPQSITRNADFFLLLILSLLLAATLPQVFFPSVAAVDKTSGHYVAFGAQAVLPEVRANSTLAHPLRSPKISKVFFFPREANPTLKLIIFSFFIPSSCWIWKVWPGSSAQPSNSWTLIRLHTEFRLEKVSELTTF